MAESFNGLNAMAESFNGLYKWELIYPKGPWRGLDDVEFATLTYVDWFNNRRLHGAIEPGPGYTTPAAFEDTYYRQTVPADHTETQYPQPPSHPGRFSTFIQLFWGRCQALPERVRSMWCRTRLRSQSRDRCGRSPAAVTHVDALEALAVVLARVGGKGSASCWIPQSGSAADTWRRCSSPCPPAPGSMPGPCAHREAVGIVEEAQGRLRRSGRLGGRDGPALRHRVGPSLFVDGPLGAHHRKRQAVGPMANGDRCDQWLLAVGAEPLLVGNEVGVVQ